jgi:hypothetical protein
MDPCLMRVDRVSDVASSVDIGGVGTQRGIDENAVVNGESGLLGESVLAGLPLRR